MTHTFLLRINVTLIVLATTLALHSVASAQSSPDDEQRADPRSPIRSQRVAPVGQPENNDATDTAEADEIFDGQRVNSKETVLGVNPSARLNNRINNRVENRLRIRIDRFYDPQANATSPFEAAAATQETRNQRPPSR